MHNLEVMISPCTWVCSTCTLINDNENAECQLCSAPGNFCVAPPFASAPALATAPGKCLSAPIPNGCRGFDNCSDVAKNCFDEDLIDTLPSRMKTKFLNALALEAPELFNDFYSACFTDIDESIQNEHFRIMVRSFIDKISTEGICSKAAPTEIPSGFWLCICTLLNNENDNRCTACGNHDPKPVKLTDSHKAALKIANELEKAELQLRNVFNCPICMTDSPIDGSYQLECKHRTCPGYKMEFNIVLFFLSLSSVSLFPSHHGTYLFYDNHIWFAPPDCLPNYIQSKINSNEVDEDQLRCPHDRCRCTILRDTIKEVCSGEVFNKYTEYVQENYILSKVREGVMRKCPSEHCNCHFELPPQIFVPVLPPDSASAESTRFGDPPDIFMPSAPPNTSLDLPQGTWINRSVSFDCTSCDTSYCVNCLANEAIDIVTILFCQSHCHNLVCTALILIWTPGKNGSGTCRPKLRWENSTVTKRSYGTPEVSAVEGGKQQGRRSVYRTLSKQWYPYHTFFSLYFL